MDKELLELLEQADPIDFVGCLKENFRKHNKQHYGMLAEIYWNKHDTEFKILSAGCRAAIIVYLHTADTRGNLWEEIH